VFWGKGPGVGTSFASSLTATLHIFATTFSVKSSESSTPSLGGLALEPRLGLRFSASIPGEEAREEAGVRVSNLSS
jgi:hypothetical protein